MYGLAILEFLNEKQIISDDFEILRKKKTQLTKKLKQKTLIMMIFANSDKNDACQKTLILLLLLMILMISYVYWIVVLIAYKWYKEMVLFTLMTQTHRLPSVYMLGHPGDVMVRSSPAPISMIPPHSVDEEKKKKKSKLYMYQTYKSTCNFSEYEETTTVVDFFDIWGYQQLEVGIILDSNNRGFQGISIFVDVLGGQHV